MPAALLTPTPTPTTGDMLHRAAVELAVDVAALLLEHRDRVGSDDAVRFAGDAVRISDHLAAARRAVGGDERRELLGLALSAARLAGRRLGTLAERSRLPLLRTAEVHHNLRSLTRALEALADTPPFP